MLNIVQWSKYRAETVSIIVSFADLLAPGDTITGTPTITVTVFTGLDPTPSDLLYQGVSIPNSSTIEQRFRLGIPGVIYHILFSVDTTLGDSLDKECYLAILPEDANAVPTWLPLFLTSQLYPLEDSGEIANSIQPISGRILNMPVWGDSMQVSIAALFGTLTGTAVSYINPHEDLTIDITPLFGTLSGTAVSYDNPHEDMKHQMAPLYGTLSGTAVSYDSPHEDMQSSITPISGTLV